MCAYIWNEMKCVIWHAIRQKYMYRQGIANFFSSYLFHSPLCCWNAVYSIWKPSPSTTTHIPNKEFSAFEKNEKKMKQNTKQPVSLSQPASQHSSSYFVCAQCNICNIHVSTHTLTHARVIESLNDEDGKRKEVKKKVLGRKVGGERVSWEMGTHINK